MMNRQVQSETVDASIDTTTLELLARWRLSDTTDNREEISAAELEVAEFKRAMNENRLAASEPAIYP